jgi:hypothetical protein
MGRCDLSKGSVINVSGDDESEESDEEIEQMEDFPDEKV